MDWARGGVTGSFFILLTSSSMGMGGMSSAGSAVPNSCLRASRRCSAARPGISWGLERDACRRSRTTMKLRYLLRRYRNAATRTSPPITTKPERAMSKASFIVLFRAQFMQTKNKQINQQTTIKQHALILKKKNNLLDLLLKHHLILIIIITFNFAFIHIFFKLTVYCV